jgi:gliding motility-associated-like protein
MNHTIKGFSTYALSICFLLLSSFSLAQDPVGLRASSATANNGEQVTIDVTVDNFNDITGVVFALYWDEDILSFADLDNLNEELMLSSNSFNLDSAGNIVIPGELVFTFDDFGGANLGDGEILFSVVLDVNGDPCDESELRIDDPSNRFQQIEILGIGPSGNFIELDVETTSGDFMIPGQNCNGPGGSDVTFIASNETADPGEEVCVSFSVQNFENVATIDLKIIYDPAVVEFEDIRNINLTGLNRGSFNLFAPGEIRVTWNSPTGGGINRPDGEIIFDVCFTVVGSNGTSTVIDFEDAEVGIQESGGDPMPETPSTVSGSVLVGDGNFDGLEFTLPDRQINEGEEFCVPVVVRNFEDIVSFEYEILFNENLIEFVELRSFNLMFLDGGNFNTTTADQGVIRALWFDDSAQGINVDDGTVIFEYCFVAVGDCPANTSVENNTGTFFEALDAQSNPVPFLIRPSEVDIVCGFSIDPAVSEESCLEACDGEIALNIDGGIAPFDIQWSGPTDVPDGTMTAQDLCEGDYDVAIIADNGFRIDTSFTISSPNAYNVDDITITDEFLGNDGEIDVSVSGGSGNFNYSWSTDPPRMGNPLSDISSGTYSLTITDTETGCELIQNDISVDLIFAVSEILTNDVSCPGENDGAAEIIVEGGSGDFSYEWSCSESSSSSVEGLSGEDCDVIITDNETGLTIERSFSIDEKDPISINPDVTDDLSADGSGAITLNPTGGAPPYTFEWNTGAVDENLDNLSVGLYTVTVTDSEGCEFTFGPIAVIDGSLLISVQSSVDMFNGNGVSCFGNCDGFIQIQVFGGSPPYEINWSDGDGFELNPLCAGDYTYTITDSEGEEEVGTVSLPEPNEIEVEVLNRGCGSEGNGFIEIEASGGSAPYEYSFNGTTFSDNNRNENLAVGDFNAFVSDANGCEVIFPYEIRSCTEGDCFQAIPVITPNGDGRNDRLVIDCAGDQNNTLEIYNRMGQLVFEQDNYSNQWEGTNNVSGDELDEGSYIWVLRLFSNGVEERVEKGTVTVLRNLR